MLLPALEVLGWYIDSFDIDLKSSMSALGLLSFIYRLPDAHVGESPSLAVINPLQNAVVPPQVF
jgi:hypothetical protein